MILIGALSKGDGRIRGGNGSVGWVVAPGHGAEGQVKVGGRVAIKSTSVWPVCLLVTSFNLPKRMVHLNWNWYGWW